MISKRKLFQYVLVHLFGRFRSTKNIIIYCSRNFHALHLVDAANNLSKCFGIRVFIVCPDEIVLPINERVILLTCNLNDFSRSIPVDLFITTENDDLPYYLSCKSIYFGHGIGPKLNYQLGRNLLAYDYIFCPCQFFYDSMKDVVGENKVRRIGLPLLDQNYLGEISNIILYAPTWSEGLKYVSDVVEVIGLLATIPGYRIIVSLHPNLERDLSPGVVEKAVSVDKADGTIVELIENSEFSTSFEVLLHAKFIVGEISSLMFEALAYDVPVVFDGNEDIFYHVGADEVLPMVKESFYRIDELVDDVKRENIVIRDPKKGKREAYSNQYLYNRGVASSAFVEEAVKILVSE